MDEANTQVIIVKCDACQKDIPRSNARLMSIKMCCKVERVPLCKDCWEKYANKK